MVRRAPRVAPTDNGGEFRPRNFRAKQWSPQSDATFQRVAAREFAALCQGTRVRRLADDTISHEALEADGHCAVQQIVSIMQDAATAATAPVSGASERRYLSQGRGGGRSTLHSVQQQLRRSLGIRRKVQNGARRRWQRRLLL